MKPRVMRRAYLREAMLMLIVARIAIRFLPMPQIFQWANRPVRRVQRFASYEARWVAWSVEAMGARRWMNASCLSCALAAQGMLRRRGIKSRLCLGVDGENSVLAAHAWIEIAGDVIVGRTETGHFKPLAQFGGGVA
jgi:hypothetical protein